MKKVIKVLSLIILFMTMLLVQVNTNKIGKVGLRIVSAEESTSQSDEELSEEDWKIELNESTQKGSKEFGFIQRNLASSDLADNGHFLLIIGVVLVVLSVTGTMFFSFCLYKLCQNTKRCTERRYTRHN
ncbi:MAG: hypothetical protein V8P98_01700 [Acutalibacteraceae bacterium]